ncbi:MAG: GAF domain-containing protein, partial [Pseudolabrys sp.]
MLANATRLCEARFGVLYLRDGDAFRAVASSRDAPPAYVEARRREPVIHPGPGTALSRAAATRQPVQIADIRAEPAYTNDPARFAILNLAGARTYFAVPMTKENEVIGIFAIYRQEVRPFTVKQIELVQNFAAQAVIAVENTRLLNELRESLQQQTATADVLKVISSSPGELEPVFDAMLANATRICEARFGVLYLREGGDFRAAVTTRNAPPEYVKARKPELLLNPPPDGPLRRVTATKHVVQITDLSKLQSYL